MTFSRLARNNVRGNLHRYVAYFLACIVSVATFYTFLSFIVSDAVRSGYIVGGGRAGLNPALIGVDVVVVIFSFLFILYSTVAFIRSRKKEFGLLTLLGMTERDLRRMVFQELGLIAGSALLVGLLGGILFSRLFFMAMANLLEIGSPIPFSVPWQAAVGTIVVFVGMFAVANGISLFGVRASSITELLKSARQPRLMPRKRPLLLLLGILLTGGGYWLAWSTNGNTFIQRAIPIVLLTVAGTYFLVTQGALFLCDGLRRHTAFYRRGTNLVVVNRLAFRLTDNARVIFICAVLVAIVGSSLGAINSVLQNARRIALQGNDYAIRVRLDSEADPAAANEQVLALLRKRGVSTVDAQFVNPIEGSLSYSQGGGETSRPVYITDNASYNRFAAPHPLVDPKTLQPGQALLLVGYDLDTPDPGYVFAGDTKLTVSCTLVKQGWLTSLPATVVLNDADYRALESASGHKHTGFLGYEFRGWEKQAGLSDEVSTTLGDAVNGLGERYNDYHDVRKIAGLTMFIGLFLASLFFVAAGSLIYFKLFTETTEDQAHYAVMTDIGITRGELNRLVLDELAVLFFMPLVIGAVHTAFALKTLSNMLNANFYLIGPGVMIGLIFLAAQAVYFLLSAASYRRTVLHQV